MATLYKMKASKTPRSKTRRAARGLPARSLTRKDDSIVDVNLLD
jgi:hypothetical protein